MIIKLIVKILVIFLFLYSSALIAQRSKRRKVEKKSASAFEKLRELKQGGTRNKWAAEESSKIYDEVDEETYTKIVSSRPTDWIVDDGELRYLILNLSYLMFISNLRWRLHRGRSRNL